MSTRRERTLAKTNSRCGYCGTPLKGTRWHEDHVQAFYRGRDDIGGDDSESNLMASCARCNRWKKTFTVEEFREEISLQLSRLWRDSAQYRLALDYGLITENLDENSFRPTVVFYFEKMDAPKRSRSALEVLCEYGDKLSLKS